MHITVADAETLFAYSDRSWAKLSPKPDGNHKLFSPGKVLYLIANQTFPCSTLKYMQLNTIRIIIVDWEFASDLWLPPDDRIVFPREKVYSLDLPELLAAAIYEDERPDAGYCESCMRTPLNIVSSGLVGSLCLDCGGIVHSFERMKREIHGVTEQR